MKKKAKARDSFPEVIHVRRDGEGDESYLDASENGIDFIEESGVPVAVYRLESIGVTKIVKSLNEVK